MKRIEKILRPFFGAARARSADIPVCGFTELESSLFGILARNWGLESPQNPQTGMSALRPAKPSPWGRFASELIAVGCVSAFLSGCAAGPNYKPPQTSVAASFANSPTNVGAADETALATWRKG